MLKDVLWLLWILRGIAEAVDAARHSDVALIFVGSSSTAFVRHTQEPSTSGEGIDLSDISLTGAQEQLIREVLLWESRWLLYWWQESLLPYLG